MSSKEKVDTTQEHGSEDHDAEADGASIPSQYITIPNRDDPDAPPLKISLESFASFMSSSTEDDESNLSSCKLPFVWKLYEMLADVESQGKEDIVSWVDDGSAFRVHKLNEFVDDVIPLYFKLSKYKSFQRQLNFYQFTRISSGPYTGAYKHPKFKKGQKILCLSIVANNKRKKSARGVTAQRSHQGQNKGGKTTKIAPKKEAPVPVVVVEAQALAQQSSPPSPLPSPSQLAPQPQPQIFAESSLRKEFLPPRSPVRKKEEPTRGPRVLRRSASWPPATRDPRRRMRPASFSRSINKNTINDSPVLREDLSPRRSFQVAEVVLPIAASLNTSSSDALIRRVSAADDEFSSLPAAERASSGRRLRRPAPPLEGEDHQPKEPSNDNDDDFVLGFGGRRFHIVDEQY